MRLKEYRKKTGLTQQQIATILNVSKPGYNSWESGRTEPDYETLKKLADYFHTTTDNLLGHDVPYLLDKSTLTQKQRDLVDLVSDMDDNICDRVFAYASGLIDGQKENQLNIEKLKKRFE